MTERGKGREGGKDLSEKETEMTGKCQEEQRCGLEGLTESDGFTAILLVFADLMDKGGR